MKQLVNKLILKDKTKHRAVWVSRFCTFLACIVLLAYALMMSNESINVSVFNTVTFKLYTVLTVVFLSITALMLFVLAILEVAEMKVNGEGSPVSKLITNFIGLFVLVFLIYRFFMKSNDSIISILLFSAGISIANLGVDYWKRDPVKIAKLEQMERENK
jgi:predicted MPP superfamily phosphohydrolase